MTTAIVTDEMIEAGWKEAQVKDIRDDRSHKQRFIDGLSAALTPHGEEAAAPAPEPQPIGFMDVEGIRTLVGDVRARPAASPSPQDQLRGVDLQQETANLTGILDYMETTNARQFDPSRVVLLIALVRDRLRAASASEGEAE